MVVAIKSPTNAALILCAFTFGQPHQIGYNQVWGIPFAAIYTGILLFQVIVTRSSDFLNGILPNKMLILFGLWSAICTANAFNPITSYEKFDFVWKSILSSLLTAAVVKDIKTFRAIMVVMAFSITAWAAKGVLGQAIYSESGRIFGPKNSMIGDNNDFAVACAVTVPLLFLLAEGTQKAWMRLVCYLGALVLVIAAIGTQSRSGFMALVVVGAGLGLVFRKNWGPLLVVSVGFSLFALIGLPENYIDRISTISDPIQDESARSRLHAWRTAVRVANENITGGGFQFYRAPEKYSEYLVSEEQRPRATHSIYFEAIGDLGWIGFLIWLTLFPLLFFRLLSRALILKRELGADVYQTRRVAFITISVGGYLMGGATINFAYWDYMFYLYVVSNFIIKFEGDSKGRGL